MKKLGLINWSKWPSFWILGPWVLGLVLAEVYPWSLFVAGLLALVFGLGAWGLHFWFGGRGFIWALVLSLVHLGIYRYQSLERGGAGDEFAVGVLGARDLLVRVVDLPKRTAWGLEVWGEVGAYGGEGAAWVLDRGLAPWGIMLRWSGEVEGVALRVGDWLRLRGWGGELGGAWLPNGFNPKAFYGNRGIKQQFWVEDYELVERASGWYYDLVDLRLSLAERLVKGLEGEREGLAQALFLGLRQDLSSELKQAYQQTGAMHVLAVSGLHLSLLAFVIQALFMALPLNRRLKAWFILILGGGVIILFTFLAGSSASVLRAAGMYLLGALALALGRRSWSFNTLFISALGLLVFNPKFLWDLGFQLSFLAVWGILYFQPWLRNLWRPSVRPLAWLWEMTSVSLAAQAATLPLCLWTFHQFPTYFWLSSWLVLPLVSVVMPLGLLHLLFQDLPYLGEGFCYLFDWGLGAMNASVYWVQGLPYGVIGDIYLSFGALLGLLLALGLWIWALAVKRGRGGRYLLGAMFCLILASAWDLWDKEGRGEQRFWLIYPDKGDLILDYIEAWHLLRLTGGEGNLDKHRQVGAAWRIRERGLRSWGEGEAGLLEPLGLYLARGTWGGEEQEALRKQTKVLLLWRLDNSLDLEAIYQDFPALQAIVLHPDNEKKHLRTWRKSCETKGLPCHDLARQGAWTSRALAPP